MFSHGSKAIAILEPRIRDNLRDCVKPLIGRTFEFEWVGISEDDEPYPGQSRWWISRKHDTEIPDECKGLWLPGEDLKFIENR
jgi:hypothetical protein